MECIKVVELFAGVGGFRLGLERASSRYNTIWANQWEPSAEEQDAYQCYLHHWGKTANCVCKDIAAVKQSIPSHDLLVGGFPCQDYSIAKKNSKGIEGKKGVLWWQIDDIVQMYRPRYILLENVDRLIRSPAKQPGRDFSVMLRCLYTSGYAVEWRVINAADYGQAQRRRRTFILAYRNDTETFNKIADVTCIKGLKGMHRWVMQYGLFVQAFPIAFHTRDYSEGWLDEMLYMKTSDVFRNHKENYHNSGLMINGRYYSVEVVPRKAKPATLKDILQTEPVAERYFLRTEDMPEWEYAKGAKDEFRSRKDGSCYHFKEGRMPFPDVLGRPGRTMMTSEGQVGRSTHVVKDVATGRLRVLTPTECERLNGFPDGWTDTGMPEQMRYFTMGNALVVPIVERIGTALLPYFDECVTAYAPSHKRRKLDEYLERSFSI